MNPELLKIIIADDDPDDATLLIEVLEKNGIDRDKFVLAEDGEKLLSLLPAYAKTPSLLFLDLNMPLKNGLQVLSEIKANPSLKHIPVLILTTSNAAKDVRYCYELGASTYFTKPGTYKKCSIWLLLLKAIGLKEQRFLNLKKKSCSRRTARCYFNQFKVYLFPLVIGFPLASK